jgi:hypothetical protein
MCTKMPKRVVWTCDWAPMWWRSATFPFMPLGEAQQWAKRQLQSESCSSTAEFVVHGLGEGDVPMFVSYVFVSAICPARTCTRSASLSAPNELVALDGAGEFESIHVYLAHHRRHCRAGARRAVGAAARRAAPRAGARAAARHVQLARRSRPPTSCASRSKSVPAHRAAHRAPVARARRAPRQRRAEVAHCARGRPLLLSPGRRRLRRLDHRSAAARRLH